MSISAPFFVASNGADDRFVLTMGNRIIVIRKEGFVYGHDVVGTTIGPGVPMNFALGHFTFATDISTENRTRLLDRHLFALTSIAGCGRLSQQERNDLISKGYDKAIHHTTLNQAGTNASATVNGSRINVNFGVLFPQGDEEISQTLIHEMMHCAGYTHPTRRDAPAGSSCAAPNPAVFDCPNDNGVYYGTAPLRAEFCIAGDQSDVQTRLEEKTAMESCVIGEDGVARLHIMQP